MKLILLFFIASVVQQSFAAPFASNSVVVFGLGVEIGVPNYLREYAFNGTLLQQIDLPSGLIRQFATLLTPQLDQTGTLILVPTFDSCPGSACTGYLYTINSQGTIVSTTSASTGSAWLVSAVVDGQDVWWCYSKSVSYLQLGATSVTTANIVAGQSEYGNIDVIQLVGTRMYMLVGNGIKYMDPVIKTGQSTVTEIIGATNPRYFYFSQPDTLYTLSVYDLVKYTVSGDTATQAYRITVPRGIDSMYRFGVVAVDGVTYIFIVFVKNNYGGRLIRYTDTGSAFTDLVTLYDGTDALHSVGPSPKLTCSDSLSNQDETDVDCGGAICGTCADDKTCQTDSDCTNTYCTADKICATPVCNDTVKNGKETDVDCGGPDCNGCAFQKSCKVNTDCIGNLCQSLTCAATCTDTTKNQDETDVDCGGAICGACADGNTCQTDSDCTNTYCTAGKICATPVCNDIVKNGKETDVDCGGPDCNDCAFQKSCKVNTDCIGNLCQSLICAATCTDTTKNQLESDVDCGGPNCNDCGNGKKCIANSDCSSGYCNPDLMCSDPSCSDNYLNQDETDVDCGGSTCPACTFQKICKNNSDCIGSLCESLICAATCTDTTKNQGETDVDCGGPNCSVCENGKMCLNQADCSSSYCNPDLMCSTPSCADTFLNQNETDVDCGGGTCNLCANDKACASDLDCESNTCTGDVCANPPVAPPVAEPVSNQSPQSTTPSDSSPSSSTPSTSSPESSIQPASSPIKQVSVGAAVEISLFLGLVVLIV